jgi:segregation and condensation protein A
MGSESPGDTVSAQYDVLRMRYEVNTPVFEGPLDLLLQLITARQLEVTEVSLSDLVGEYLAYLELMRSLDLDITSEFLVIAATLIQLKARRLLPEDLDVDLDEDLALSEERDRLLARLLACLTYKDVAAVMHHRLETTAELVGRVAGPDPDVSPPAPEIRIPTGIEGLAAMAQRLLSRRHEPDLDHLELDLPSVALAVDDVRSRLREAGELEFEALTSHCTRPMEVIAYFLAVLELNRWGLIRASQDDLDAAIGLRHLKHAEAGLTSEWAE